jgi:hypothetical protein
MQLGQATFQLRQCSSFRLFRRPQATWTGKAQRWRVLPRGGRCERKGLSSALLRVSQPVPVSILEIGPLPQADEVPMIYLVIERECHWAMDGRSPSLANDAPRAHLTLCRVPPISFTAATRVRSDHNFGGLDLGSFLRIAASAQTQSMDGPALNRIAQGYASAEVRPCVNQRIYCRVELCDRPIHSDVRAREKASDPDWP